MKERLETTIAELSEFLYHSPTPQHTTRLISDWLAEQGLVKLNLSEDWELKAGQGYFILKAGTLIAFYAPDLEQLAARGWRIVGAHTDSPCLKLRPKPWVINSGYPQLEVEIYGGVKLDSWFDRDLSIAGQVFWQDKDQQFHQSLIDFETPCVSMLSLAAHLQRPGKTNKLNLQQEIIPLFLNTVLNTAGPKLQDPKIDNWHAILLAQIEKQLETKPTKILNHDLCLYDSQPPQKIGAGLASARLDNLVSCYSATKAFMHAKTPANVLVLYNFEEIGSQTYQGAQSPLLEHILNRVTHSQNLAFKAMANSSFLSVDCAHALHPNYPDRYAASHSPLLNQGVVIKQAARQTYASDPELHAKMNQIWQKAEIPLQIFVANASFPSGRTIAPITAANLGLATLDIGIATFAMHSIRELIGQQDVQWLNQAIDQYFNS